MSNATPVSANKDSYYKEVTLAEVIEAIQLPEGLTIHVKDFFDTGHKNNKHSASTIPPNSIISAADAIGCAAINLGVEPESLYDSLNEGPDEFVIDPYTSDWPPLGDNIAGFNDMSYGLPDIKREMLSYLGKAKGGKILVRRAIYTKQKDGKYLYKPYLG